MHEMSIAQSILKIVTPQAERNGAKKITLIRVRAGELRGIVQEQLSFLFEFVAKDTIAEGAKLVVEKVPIKSVCNECKHEFMVQEYSFICPECESKDVDTIEGMELAVKDIEIE
jgi:hydrogenase nickel incorporation protein HypA/HybF